MPQAKPWRRVMRGVRKCGRSRLLGSSGTSPARARARTWGKERLVVVAVVVSVGDLWCWLTAMVVLNANCLGLKQMAKQTRRSIG